MGLWQTALESLVAGLIRTMKIVKSVRFEVKKGKRFAQSSPTPPCARRSLL
jgi:hypothetical protein